MYRSRNDRPSINHVRYHGVVIERRTEQGVYLSAWAGKTLLLCDGPYPPDRYVVHQVDVVGRFRREVGLGLLHLEASARSFEP